MQQSHIVLPLASPFSIALVFLLVLAALFQGAYSHTEKQMHGQRIRHKIARREGRASSVLTPSPLSSSPYFRKIGRMAWCAQVSLQSIRHRSRCEARKAALATRQCHSRPSSVLASTAGHHTCWKLLGMARLGASKRAAGHALRIQHGVCFLVVPNIQDDPPTFLSCRYF